MGIEISQDDFMEFARLKAEEEARKKIEEIKAEHKEELHADKKSKKYGGIKWDEKKKAFMVRLYHRGKEYPVQNFTKIYDCKDIEDVEKEIDRQKEMYDKGENPRDNRTFGERMYDYLDTLKNPKTKSISTNSYNKHCKAILHDKKPNQLSQTDIKKIYNKMKADPSVNSVSTIKRLRSTISPVYKDLFNTRKININYLINEEYPDFENEDGLLPLNERLNDVDYQIIARKLYNGIMKIERADIKNFFLISLMCARRRAEVFRYEKKHIKQDKIRATKDITKTKITDEFPIPDEIKEYIEKSNKELVFKVDEKSYYRAWKKLLEEQEIEFTQVFRLYDTRHLFSSTMQEIHPEKFKVIDECLSHIPKNIANTYHSRRFDKRKEIFVEYWDILRGN